ncbi:MULTISPECIES: hypothetical protein [unclassified Pantoea]|uniref:hypothetical protein n=1 Tax=unclassified Pantoea TaxID=2630326 RepID=UPI001CD2F07A|nr:MULTISPECIES: hypothetical protein [unclassified Pantoea]MCA1179567.1 hypothetical protein [Pantoea sp. alder69]MCA1251820.1 hypothetical protein [Pantoea sp. alder70]MCA1267843.1 hypothetical protein [Pantoea sp. alder81]
MTISSNVADLLQLAEFESDMLTALAYQSLGLDDLDEEVQNKNEPPYYMAIQFDVVYGLEFGRAQGRYLTSGCADMVSSIRAMSVRLDPDLHKRISLSGHHDCRGDLEIARLESF